MRSGKIEEKRNKKDKGAKESISGRQLRLVNAAE